MPSSLPAVLAAAVRAERARLDYSQRALALAMGWSSHAIVADIEAGKRALRVEELPLLCEVLEVSLAQLLAHADPADLNRMGLPFVPPARAGRRRKN